MLSVHGRKPAAVLIEPVAKKLLTMGITPNTVTLIGTGVAVAFALWLIPTGHHFAAAVIIGFTTAFDMVDGTMARMRGGGTKFGATLDASCDRITDGAIFGALVFWFASQHPTNLLMVALCLLILVASQVTSYVKARAEASGVRVDGGLIERPERLIISLVALGLDGLGVPHMLSLGLWILVLGSAFTVAQRLYAAARAGNASEHIAPPSGAKEYHSGNRSPQHCGEQRYNHKHTPHNPLGD